MNFLDLPDCMIEQIFSFLSYDEIAKKRLVSNRIDKVCKGLLNHGFAKIMKRHSTNLRRIKSLLPRRESERRNHALARHADILTCIETRISMLSMTYTKYMELNLCCFIPGKVIDEVQNILHLIETTDKPLRAHEVLQELRDISSMAIEHFDEKIAHLLKKTVLGANVPRYVPGTFHSVISVATSDEIISIPNQFSPDIDEAPTSAQNESCPMKCQDVKYNILAMSIARMERKYQNAMKKLNVAVQIQNKQMRQLRNNAVQMSEMNSQIVDLRRRLEESDAKNREISANVSQITLDATGQPAGAGAGVSTSTPKERVNIKPRTATIILKRRINQNLHLQKNNPKKLKPCE